MDDEHSSTTDEPLSEEFTTEQATSEEESSVDHKEEARDTAFITDEPRSEELATEDDVLFAEEESSVAPSANRTNALFSPIITRPPAASINEDASPGQPPLRGNTGYTEDGESIVLVKVRLFYSVSDLWLFQFFQTWQMPYC